jgi:hypothetical protein
MQTLQEVPADLRVAGILLDQRRQMVVIALVEILRPGLRRHLRMAIDRDDCELFHVHLRSNSFLGDFMTVSDVESI